MKKKKDVPFFSFRTHRFVSDLLVWNIKLWHYLHLACSVSEPLMGTHTKFLVKFLCVTSCYFHSIQAFLFLLGWYFLNAKKICYIVVSEMLSDSVLPSVQLAIRWHCMEIVSHQVSQLWKFKARGLRAAKDQQHMFTPCLISFLFNLYICFLTTFMTLATWPWRLLRTCWYSGSVVCNSTITRSWSAIGDQVGGSSNPEPTGKRKDIIIILLTLTVHIEYKQPHGRIYQPSE